MDESVTRRECGGKPGGAQQANVTARSRRFPVHRTEAGALAAGFSDQVRTSILPSLKTVRPATIVVLTRPVSVWPAQGELADLLKPPFAS